MIQLVSYFGPVSSPITIITMPYACEGFIYPSSHSVLVTIPLIPGTQSQTEEISQMLSNVTFSSPPISPQVTDDNQQPITSVDVTKDTVSE